MTYYEMLRKKRNLAKFYLCSELIYVRLTIIYTGERDIYA